MKRWLFPRPEKVLFWAFLGMVILIGGCCSPGLLRAWRPWFPPCDPTHCAQGCCSEGFGGVGPTESAGASEADLACQGCLPSPPPPPGCYPGPLSWLFARIVWPYGPGFAGCGQRYWSPWVDDPPDCCDPCDHHGQWIGQQRGVGYSSMYPNLFPGPIQSEAPMGVEPESASDARMTPGPMPGPRQPARPGCSQCGQGYQTRSGQRPGGLPVSPPNRLTPNQGVWPAGYSNLGGCPADYSNVAQRPRQPYRDPVTR